MPGIQDNPPTGYGSNNPGKGGSIIKPPKKSEASNETPTGYSAKGSKDQGKDAQTSRAGKEDKKLSKSEAPDETPSGVNDMTIPHVHLPEMLHQKEGDEVHLHVYGKIKAHNMEKGKNHAIVEVKSVKPMSESKHADFAQAPMDELKKTLMGAKQDQNSGQSM